MTDTDCRVLELRALLAPGTPLRTGLERIQNGRTGALILLGETDIVREISTGGFHLDAPFSPTGLRELAKMDGAIVVNDSCTRILAAGVHLMPDAALPTIEAGTRHRTADRVAQQTGCPVITVSASMNSIALFLRDRRLPVEAPGAILGRANMALQTLERYRVRLKQVLVALSALEVQDQVTVRDLVEIAQRVEMVRRLEAETQGYVTELGTDGRLLGLQLVEIDSSTDMLCQLLTDDYLPQNGQPGEFGFEGLTELADHELLDGAVVARAIGFTVPLEAPVSVRGYRQLAGLPRLPTTVAHRLVDHFDGLQGIIGASTSELREVEGVGDQRARMIRDFLAQIAETAYIQLSG